MTPLGSTGTTPPDSHNPTPLPASKSSGSPFKDKIIEALGIPMELMDHKDINLGYAWQKYNACTKAIATCESLWKAGKLKTVFDWKPTQADIISIFKGKSQWHLTYNKAFPKLSSHPTMVSWLEDRADKLSDVELWGISKPIYVFSDLLEWLGNGGEGLTQVETETESDVEEVQKGREKGKARGKKEKENKRTRRKGSPRAKIRERAKQRRYLAQKRARAKQRR